MKVYPRKLRLGLPTNDMLTCLSRSLCKYYKAGELCDIAIKCTSDDTTVFAHKLILCAMSPFFHNALIGPLSSKGDVELPFTSTTVKLLLDCLYHKEDESEPDWETVMVDIMEFVHLAMYLDMTALVKHGLRVAASKLDPEWCLDHLISVTEQGANPIPHQWNVVVIRYVVDHMQYHYLNHEEGRILYDRYIKKLTPVVMQLLIRSFLEFYHPLPHVKFIDKFLQSFLDQHTQLTEEDNLTNSIDLRKSFENFVSLNKDIISMIDFVMGRDLQKKEKVCVVNRPRVDEVLVQLRTVTSYDDDTDISSNIKAWEVDYAWNPKKSKLIVKEDIGRFSNSLSEILYEMSSYAGMHREDERKCFMWGGSLFSAHFYLETRDTELMMYLVWERYDWVKGRWIEAYRRGPGFNDQGQLTVVENGLIFPGHIVSCISWEMFSFTLCYNTFAVETRLIVSHEGMHFSTYFFHQEADPSCMQLVVVTDKYMEDVRLLVFFTPLSAGILPIAEEIINEQNDVSEVDFAHPDDSFGTQTRIGKIISFNNLVFHFYSVKCHNAPCGGIHVDRLDFETKTWIKLEDLCNKRKFVDAFVLNEEIYLMFSNVESEAPYFIAKCLVTDNLAVQLVKSSERRLKESEDDHYVEKVQRFVVPKSVMPLDFI